MGTSIERSSSRPTFAVGGPCRIPGEEVDGMDVMAVRSAAAARRRARPVGARALHPGDEDLPLSRPLHVATRPSTGPEGGGREGAPQPRPDRSAVQKLIGRRAGPTRRRSRPSTREVKAPSSTDAAEFARDLAEPDPAELLHRRLGRLGRGEDVRNILMPALSPTMDRGQPRQVAREGQGDAVQLRRRHRRDRDRQGDHGGRGRRRRRASRPSWCRRAPRGSRSTHRSPPCCSGEGERRRLPRAARRAPAATPRPPLAQRRPRLRRAAQPAARHAAPAAEDRLAGRRMTVARRPARRHGRGDAPRTPTVFLMGEEVGAVPGRLQGQPGPAGGIRRRGG
jgi:hypothetical protein